VTALAGVNPDGFFEAEAYARGFRCIAGVDEAGRGPLAGPVVAAAVVLPRHKVFPGLRDSKCLSPVQRDQLFSLISDSARATSIGYADSTEIDEIGIVPSTLNAIKRAVFGLLLHPDYLLIDALSLPGVKVSQRAIVKGDSLSCSIAAASVIAKVSRDRMMFDLHEKFPHYNFRSHKGYGTAEHLRLLEKFGPCDAHRKCFRPVSNIMADPSRATYDQSFSHS